MSKNPRDTVNLIAPSASPRIPAGDVVVPTGTDASEASVPAGAQTGAQELQTKEGPGSVGEIPAGVRALLVGAAGFEPATPAV